MNNKTNQRIGYYACQWGINIKSKVNCDELVEYVKNEFPEEIIISKKTRKSPLRKITIKQIDITDDKTDIIIK